MKNDRLRSAITSAGLTGERLADSVGVDAKTVERWMSTGRLPQRIHRWKTAEILQREETYLWPELLDHPQATGASDSEILRVYPHRGAVPVDLWHTFLAGPKESLDVLVYAGLFLVDTSPELPDHLVRNAQGGVKTRILLGDPESSAVNQRGIEEGIGQQMAARVRLSLGYFEPTFKIPEIEVRLHSTSLYNSIYRSDESMLVNIQAYGLGARESPVLHLQKVPGGQLFDFYSRSFAKVWDTAVPLNNGTQ